LAKKTIQTLMKRGAATAVNAAPVRTVIRPCALNVPSYSRLPTNITSLFSAPPNGRPS
jgi:hypothetical protein